jgi:hypothetical protein
MQTDEMIPATECCIHYQIETTFIDSLRDAGLIEVTVLEEQLYLPATQLPRLEKMVRLYYEMDINLEGIETITYLLQRMNEMQQEIIGLNNRLLRYEEGGA